MARVGRLYLREEGVGSEEEQDSLGMSDTQSRSELAETDSQGPEQMPKLYTFTLT